MKKFVPEEGKRYRPAYPPKNEHYLDWIAVLKAVEGGRGVYRMAELGAGWARWLVRAATASAIKPDIRGTEFVGVEADPVHYNWMWEHFSDNAVDPMSHYLVNGAVTVHSGSVEFPKLDEPGTNYGASVSAARRSSSPTITVQALTIREVMSRFSGPVDLMHLDIQGEEYDVIPDSLDIMGEQVKAFAVGTHFSLDAESELNRTIADAGWRLAMTAARGKVTNTRYGKIQMGDGFHLWLNPSFFPDA